MPRADFDRLADREIRAVLGELKAGLRDLALKGGKAIPAEPTGDGTRTEFDRMVAVRRRAALEEEIGRLEDEIVRRIGEATEAAGQAAAQEAASASAGDGLPGVGINSRAVAAAQASAASEVRGVLDSARVRLNTAITKGISGRLSATELSAEIAASFDVPQPAARIEKILRTELGGIYMAQQAEVDELLADTGPDLIRRWVHVGGKAGIGENDRPNHLAVHNQERELDQPFDLAGGADHTTPPGGGTYHPKAPLDASLPPEERINCR